MQPRASSVNLDATRTLAHALYYQCSELSGSYETASRHLKVLHDTLGKLCEISEYISASHETGILEKVVSECSKLLNAIDRALEYQDRQPLANNERDVKFTGRLESATNKLLNTYKLIVGTDESNVSYLPALNEQRIGAARSIIVQGTDYELDGAGGTVNRAQLLGSPKSSAMAPSNVVTHPPGSSLHRVLARPTPTDANTKGWIRPSPLVSNSWKTPFALADPMSSDIETASRLILADDTTISSTSRALDVSVASALSNISDTDSGQRRHDMIPSADSEQPSTSNSIRSYDSVYKAFDKVDSVYGNGEDAMIACNSSQEPLLSKTHKGSSRPHSCTTALSTESTYSTLTQPGQPIDSRPRYRIVNADPVEELEDTSDDASIDGNAPKEPCHSIVPVIPRKNSRRTLGHSSSIVAQNRKARVFEWSCEDVVRPMHEDMKAFRSHTASHNSGVQTADPTTVPSAGLESSLDMGFAARIIQHWNSGNLTQADLNLEIFLNHRPSSLPPLVERRIRHLLGVIASLEGRWEQALVHFVSVLSIPSLDTARLDNGDCAAAYWLGDIYMLFNRRVEALVAYSIVKKGTANLRTSCTASYQQLLVRLQVELAFCRDGIERTSFELQLDEAMQQDGFAGTDSVINAEIMTKETAKELLEHVQWSPKSPPIIKSAQSRAMALRDLDPNSTAWQDIHRLQLSASALTSSAPWPMPFDPLFATGNVACGLTLSSECDLLHLKAIPRASGSLSRKRLNCFTCQDPYWLIITLRACMEKLGLKYTEYANTTGAGLISRYSFTDAPYASTNFISISIFRLTIRSGFGVEICPGGVFSSRVTQTEKKNDEQGSQAQELKRIKRLIRNYLDAALRRQEALEDEVTVIPVMSINGVTSIQRGTLAKGKKRQSGPPGSPASSSRDGSLFS